MHTYKNISIERVGLSITGRCTLSCRYCSANSNPNVKEQYSFAEIESILDILVDYNVKHIFITGGEPLLHEDIDKIVNAISARGMHIGLSTNGELVDQDILAKLFDAGLKEDIGVTLDGPSKEVHDRIRGKGSFPNALKAMYHLNKFSKISWGINYISSRLNFASAVETAGLAKRMGASAINLIRVIPIGRGRINRDDLWIEKINFQSEFNALKERYRFVGKYFDDCAIFSLSEQDDNLSYLFDDNIPPYGISVLYTGQVFFTPSGLLLGNIKETELNDLVKKLWNDPVIQVKHQAWLKEDLTDIVNNSGERI